MLDAHEVAEALAQRRADQRVLDTYGDLRFTYNQWHQEILTIYRIYANEFDVIWPDGAVTQGLPKVSNFLQIAADDRSREVAGVMPSLVCPVDKLGDSAKRAAEKRERITHGYWDRSQVMLNVPMWAYDAMAGGMTACLVWPNLEEKDRSKRYPCYQRLDPLLSYPDPIFTRKPHPDSFIYAYEQNVRSVEKQYGVSLSLLTKPMAVRSDRVLMIEFYDDTEVTIVARAINGPSNPGNKPSSEIVRQERHGLGICPIALGARPTMDGIYRSEFMGGIGITNTLNHLITMILDDAKNKVYAPTMSYNLENPEEWGPGAHLIKEGPDSSFEWVQPPNQPFSNLQIVRDLMGSARAANLMPPSRSGDPNESIISAAGINASQAQHNSDVRAIQTGIISPMLTSANEIAYRVDELYCQPKGKKPIYSDGALHEDYSPAEDIAGNYRNKVVYGMRAGLDPINQGVMALQQFGAGGITRRTLMELSPFVEDVQREEKQRLLEQVDEAVLAGLIAQAGQGQLDAVTLANIRRMVDSDEASLHDAIALNAPLAPAPLAAPPPTAAGSTPVTPGLAGAAEGQSLEQNSQAGLPALSDILGA